MKILYVTTVGATMNFFYDLFCGLKKEGHAIELACCSSWGYKECIAELGLVHHEIPFSRSPLSRCNIRAYKQLLNLIKRNRYDIVHCHTPVAAAITRLACRKIRGNGTKVIYTAHGFHFYKGAPKKNWLIYYPVEWLCAHWTDVLITINSEDYDLAQRKMKAKKVEYVPGVGIDIDKFGNVKVAHKEKREDLGIPQDAILLFSVGELNKNKNHETVIRAIKGLDVYYMIAGKGNREQLLRDVATEVGMEKRVKFLGYRTDVRELLKASDAFVFPSYREGLSVSLMEAMACGLPAVVSDIRGNRDLIDDKGGKLYEPHSITACRSAINETVKNPMNMRAMGKHNQEKICMFKTQVVIQKMKDIYESVCDSSRSK